LSARVLHDADGAGGSSLSWFAPDADTARSMVRALLAEGIPAAQMYDGEPVYLNPALMARRTASGKGGPWDCAEHPTSARYRRGMCPRTEDLAARSVTVGIGPAFSDQDCDDVAAGVRKVAMHLISN
jgi:hypothetical protein